MVRRSRPLWPCGVVLALVAVCALPGHGQEPAAASADGGTRWGLLDALGYGGLGFGLGLMAAWDIEGDGFGPPGSAVALVGAGTLGGVVAGAVIGRRASRAVREGRTVGPAHAAAVVGGVVLAGGILGAAAAVPLINPEGEGTVLGSDERTLTILILTGAAAGALYAAKHHGELSSRVPRPRSFGWSPWFEGGRWGLALSVGT